MKKLTRTIPDWTGALCAQTDPELFFPDRTNISNGYLAKKICAKCPLIDKCLDYALDHWDIQGIWGGTNETQRWQLRARRNRERKAC